MGFGCPSQRELVIIEFKNFEALDRLPLVQRTRNLTIRCATLGRFQILAMHTALGSSFVKHLGPPFGPLGGPRGVLPEYFDPWYIHLGTRVIHNGFRHKKPTKNMHQSEVHTSTFQDPFSERHGHSWMFDFKTSPSYF